MALRKASYDEHELRGEPLDEEMGRKRQRRGDFNFQSFMKDMMFEFFKEKQEQMQAYPRSSLGFRESSRMPSDPYPVRNSQFKNWFADQMASYYNSRSNRQYLTYGDEPR